jgi:hypothetical protein
VPSTIDIGFEQYGHAKKLVSKVCVDLPRYSSQPLGPHVQKDVVTLEKNLGNAFPSVTTLGPPPLRPCVDIVKIDAKGYDFCVLRGARLLREECIGIFQLEDNKPSATLF